MGRPYALLRAGFPYVKTLGASLFTDYPQDLAVGRDGVVYILSARPGPGFATIVKLTWEEEVLGKISGPGSDDGKFLRPVALVLDGAENLLVSDDALHQITILDKEGEFLGKWGEHGDGDGQMNRPSGIALDSEENLYVVDTLNHRVQKFTKDGKFLMRWGSHGNGDGEFDMPWGIAVDDLGDVYVSDWRNDRVQKFTADGEFVFKLGRSGSGDGEFDRPAGVAVDKDGDIYVADTRNNRVQLFSQEGRYVEKFIGDATLSKMARDRLLITSKSLRVREMAVLEPEKRFRDPRAVKVDAQGRMYVADYLSFRVQVYQKDAIPLSEDQIAPPMRYPKE